jgi:hypothetical protein
MTETSLAGGRMRDLPDPVSHVPPFARIATTTDIGEDHHA